MKYFHKLHAIKCVKNQSTFVALGESIHKILQQFLHACFHYKIPLHLN